jgi:hypothetical protein
MNPPSEKWDDLDDLIRFFNNREIPANPIKLNDWSTIIDPGKFVQSNVDIIQANNGNPTYRPYFNRLQQLQEIIKRQTP